MMLTIGGLQEYSQEEEMSVLYGTSYEHPNVELRKNQDLVYLNPHSYYDNHNHKQQNQHTSGLMRYRSAPGSFFDTLVNGSNVGGEDYHFSGSSSPKIDTILERFMSSSGDDGSGGSNPHDVQELEGDRPAAAIKQEVTEPALVFQRNFQVENLSSINCGSSLDRPFVQATKIGSGNGSNLARQSSSNAGFFSNLGVENGFSVIRDSGNYRSCNGTIREASPRPSRLSNQLSFSSGPWFLPQISETADENGGATSPDGKSENRKRQYMSDFQNGTWDDSSFNSLKRSREDDSKMFSAFNDLDNQNANPANLVSGLTHHLSLPKMEKLLQFQSCFPCKIRAKRGCATHPRSIAERVRRTRISERMRKLQQLFPNMDKQTNTADMLESAVEYIKDLQSLVKALSDTKARCKCSSIHKRYSRASA